MLIGRRFGLNDALFVRLIDRYVSIYGQMASLAEARHPPGLPQAAGFRVEAQEAWSPFPIGGLGKVWWVARLG